MKIFPTTPGSGVPQIDYNRPIVRFDQDHWFFDSPPNLDQDVVYVECVEILDLDDDGYQLSSFNDHIAALVPGDAIGFLTDGSKFVISAQTQIVERKLMQGTIQISKDTRS